MTRNVAEFEPHPLLRNAGYSLRKADNWAPLPLDAEQLERLIPDGASINVIAQAKDLAARYRALR